MGLRPFTDENRAEVERLVGEGLSLRAIAEQIGFSYKTVCKHCGHLRGVAVSRVVQRILAELNEADRLLEKARLLIEKVEYDDITIPSSQAARYLAESLRNIAETARWVEDMRVCVRVDNNVPAGVDYRRVDGRITKVPA